MKESESTQPGIDPFGTAELLKLVVQKLASQALLFGLAIVAATVAAWKLTESAPLVVAILFVFMTALAGYLFVEQKGKVDRAEPATMNKLNAEKMDTIMNSSPANGLSVELWTAAASSGSRDIAIAARKNAADYRIGDKIVVGFRASRDCHLTLLNVGTSGKLTVLFPNAMHPDNFIQGGRDYRIPDPDDGFEYQLQGPPGVEKLKAVATLQKVTLLETNFTSDGSLFRTVDAASGARDIQIVKKTTAALPAAEWAESAREFSVA